MIWSKYNYLFNEEERFFLYNSLSNAYALLDEHLYNILMNIKPGMEVCIDNLEQEEKLKRMKALVNDDRDEFLKLKYLSRFRKFDNHLLMLTINPTLDCNFSCPYCFEKSHRRVYMSDKVEDDIVTFIKKHEDVKKIEVTWFGGEPLLAFDRIMSLTKKITDLGIDYDAGMITNGYLLSEKYIKKLESLKIKSLQITIDGLSPIHDKRRCLKDGTPTYDVIINNIKKAKKIYPSVNINIRVNVDKTNANDFVELYRFSQTDALKGIRLTPAFVDDINRTNPCVFNDQEKYHYMVDLLKKHGIVFSGFYPSIKRECCVRNANTVVIGPMGELYKCWNDVGNRDMVYGYLDGSITNEKVLLRYLASSDAFEDETCKECILLPICYGGCPFSRIQREYESKDVNLCPLQKGNLKEFLLTHYQIKNNI